jgi:hypothetical protein
MTALSAVTDAGSEPSLAECGESLSVDGMRRAMPAGPNWIRTILIAGWGHRLERVVAVGGGLGTIGPTGTKGFAP